GDLLALRRAGVDRLVRVALRRLRIPPMQPDQQPRPRTMLQSYLLLGLVALLLGTAYAVVLWRMQPSAGEHGVLAAAPDSKESFATVLPFELTDSTGRKVTYPSLLGRP